MAEGVAIWVSGPNDAAVARVAEAVHDRLARRHVTTELLDARLPALEPLAGADMDRRVAVVARFLVRHGVAVVVAVPSVRRASREAIRADIGRMIEVYVGVAGGRIDYEAPARAEVQVDFPESELDAACERTLRTLELLHYLPPADDPSYTAEEERQVIRRLKSFGYL
jgi:adenylylsulfate kinase-like enzyme